MNYVQLSMKVIHSTYKTLSHLPDLLFIIMNRIVVVQLASLTDVLCLKFMIRMEDLFLDIKLNAFSIICNWHDQV